MAVGIKTQKNRDLVKKQITTWKDSLLKKKIMAKELKDQALLDDLIYIEGVLKRKINDMDDREYEDTDIT